MPDAVQRQFSNDPAELRAMAAWFRDVAERAGLDADLRWKAEVCLNEATTNIVTHAYDDVRPHAVSLEIQPMPHAVRITIVDDGRPFNPLEAAPPPEVASIEEAPIGGLGIHLIRSFAQEVSYRRDGDRNVLVLAFSL
jgi:anti-sigma regulatory factor (Ser/Thr protein kinase)